MSSAAVTGILAALYLSDLTTTTLTDQALVDSGDHLTYQAAWGKRRWDPAQAVVIEKNGSPITTGFTVNHLLGSITFAAEQAPEDDFTATCEQMDLVEVLDLRGDEFSGSAKMLESSNRNVLWEEYLAGKKSWQISADLWFVDGTYWDLLAAGRLVLERYYVYGTSKKLLVGWCQIDGVNWSVPQDGLQTSKITVKGDAGLYWDTNGV